MEKEQYNRMRNEAMRVQGGTISGIYGADISYYTTNACS